MIKPLTQIDALKLGKTIQFDDFDISWAGANPFGGGYCFGSDDGRFRTLLPDGVSTQPIQVTNLDEAVNGIAFSDRFMAVSNRCEVVFRDLDPQFNHLSPATYRGGAFHVLATSAGGFVAPLGVNGLLRVPEVGDSETRFLVNTFPDKSANLYQLALLHGDGTRDFIGSAARKDGIYTFELNSEVDGGRPGSSVYYKSPGLDIVSVCSLDAPDWPNSLASVAGDGSIHLFRDIRAREEPASFRIDEMLGWPYTILHAKGHLFVLTSRAIYACPNLAAHFLDGNLDHNWERVKKIELRAVDLYVAGEEILIEMANHVIVAEVDEFVSLTSSAHDATAIPSRIESIRSSWINSLAESFV
jgi:hypothetical protein